MRTRTFAISSIMGICMLVYGCNYFFNNAPSSNLTKLSAHQNYPLQSVLWQQHAAEYKALCYQAFNTARWQLDKILAEKQDSGNLAIVTDIDETVLDNSPYNGKLIKTGEEYDKSTWMEWGKLKAAAPVPGALAFFQYAKEKGVEVFYISNRYNGQKAETMANLKKHGFPFVDSAHVLLKTESSGKESRREKVRKFHEIIMLLGDNLSDFTEVFDGKSTQERNNLADSLSTVFGSRFIVLPNPMYGDWETKGIFEGRYDWTAAQKDSIRRSKVVAY